MSPKVRLPERQVIYKNDQWMIKEFNYDIQYFPYYRSRLSLMKPKLIRASKSNWPEIPVYSLSDLADNKIETDQLSQDSQECLDDLEALNPMIGREVSVVGTLFKKMPCQPNILKEIDDNRKLIEPSLIDNQKKSHQKFLSPNDTLYLQDDDESIELKGDQINMDQYCTGICVAVKGKLNPEGSGFLVEDVCFASNDTQINIQKPLLPKDYYVLIVSGLSFTNDLVKNQNLTLSLNILYDIAVGNSKIVLDKPIVNLILAGNNLNPTNPQDQSGGDCQQGVTEPWSQKNKSNCFEAVNLFDKFLANTGQYMFVDVMPGQQDLCTFLWPQQPLHPCLFPKAFRLTTIRSVTNPHRAQYFGVDILGTSGQNVDSIRSSTSYDDSLEIMRNLLEWSHLSPNSPDLLHSYPFEKDDPFILDDYPDIFFAGNQPEFGIGSFQTPDGHKTVRLISIPSFAEKFIGVMVNLRTLDCEMLAFN